MHRSYPQAFRKQIERQIYSLYRQADDCYAIELEITGRCHHSCPYCGSSAIGNSEDIDYEQLKQFLTRAAILLKKTHRSLQVSLCGGDPLRYPYFGSLVHLLKRLDIPFLVKGNPSSLSEDRIALLSASTCQGIKLTLFGNPVTHNANRGPDTFELLVAKTELLKSYHIPVIWHLSVCRANLAQTLEMLPQIASVAPDGITIGRIAKIGRLADDDSFEDIPPGEYRDFLLAVLKFYEKHHSDGFRVLFREKLWLPLLAEQQLVNLSRLDQKRIAIGCDAYVQGPTVTNQGQIIYCGLMPSLKIGSLSQWTQNPNQLLTHAPLSMDPLSTCHNCKYAIFCRDCRAIALANAGDLYAKDPQCWLPSETQDSLHKRGIRQPGSHQR